MMVLEIRFESQNLHSTDHRHRRPLHLMILLLRHTRTSKSQKMLFLLNFLKYLLPKQPCLLRQ
jgi:hypothetical protein